MTTHPHFFALEPMTLAVNGENVSIARFEEIPEAASSGDWIVREIRAGRVAASFAPPDAELQAALNRLGYKAAKAKSS